MYKREWGKHSYRHNIHLHCAHALLWCAFVCSKHWDVQMLDFRVMSGMLGLVLARQGMLWYCTSWHMCGLARIWYVAFTIQNFR